MTRTILPPATPLAIRRAGWTLPAVHVPSNVIHKSAAATVRPPKPRRNP